MKNQEPDKIFCKDLPTSPETEAGTILITGATGYIGGRLVPELIERGYTVRVMVRNLGDGYRERWPGAEIIKGDAHDPASLEVAMENVYAAYYLIHSLMMGTEKLEALEIKAAANFRTAAEKKGVKRIIYLGALGDTKDSLSIHLKSRIQVAEELKSGKVQATILRAAIIIGSGSASFEIINNLVKKLPVIFVPKCARTKCQPVSIRDVIKYLVGCLETQKTTGKEYDIGGDEILTYDTMLKVVASVIGKNRFIFPVPYLSTPLFAYLAGLLTPVPAPITRSLIEGLGNEVVCRNNDISKMIPFERVPFREALRRAMKIERRDEIPTRWSDSYPPTCDTAVKFHELNTPPKYSCSYLIESEKDAVSLYYSMCRIGGKEGWFYSNWMWRIRGKIDRVLMGVGTARGRRSQSELRENDVIDFFRVEKLVRHSLLLLRAEMKLPGKAWLEFTVSPTNRKTNILRVSAYFEPDGLFGRLYWYFFLPFHYLIFTRLISIIEQRSRSRNRH